MRTLLKLAAVIVACNFFVACAKKKKNENEPNAQKPFKIEDVGGDQTDIFAIPFDTSEFEEQQEIDKLKSLETKAPE